MEAVENLGGCPRTIRDFQCFLHCSIHDSYNQGASMGRGLLLAHVKDHRLSDTHIWTKVLIGSASWVSSKTLHNDCFCMAKCAHNNYWAKIRPSTWLFGRN